MKKFVLILGLIFFLSLPAWAVNDSLLFFEKQVQYQLGAVYSSTVFPDSIVDDFINRACREVVSYTGSRAACILKQDTVVLAPSTVQYSLNTDNFKTLKIHPLRYSRQGLDYIPLGDWGKNPSGGLADVARYTALDPIQKLLVDPKPTVVDTLLVFYNAYAITLSGDTANTNLTTEWSNAVIYYATALCQIRVENYQEATYYFTLFDTEMEKLIAIFSSPPYDVVITPKVVKR